MTLREQNLAVFQREPTEGVLFQPRIEPWIEWQNRFNAENFPLKGQSVLEVYDRFGLSMRYVDYYTGQPRPVVMEFDEVVRQTRTDLGKGQFAVVRNTPFGSLTEVVEWTVDETWRTVEFPFKGRDDVDAFCWLMEHTTHRFDSGLFAQGDAYIGDRGVPQFYLPKSPYQALAQTWMGFEDFQFFLADEPKKAERVFAIIDRTYNELYKKVCGNPNVKIVNFGENLHAHLLSPAYLDRYLLPWFEKRAGELRSAGIFSHVHWDGYYKPCLSYLSRLACDGIEALTPLPQGDATLEETRDAIGDKVLLDGIPAVLFLSMYSMGELQDCVEEIIKRFSPNLVLGISDEIPEAADASAIPKLEWISRRCGQLDGSDSLGSGDTETRSSNTKHSPSQRESSGGTVSK
jgi:hypothetical protein